MFYKSEEMGMMKLIVKVVTYILLLVIVISIPETCIALSKPSQVLKIAPDDILEHVRVLSKFKSRVSGYEDCITASRYIEKLLRDYGYTVVRHSFNVTVPVDHGSSVVFDISGREKIVKAYALAPNSVETCYTEGTSGDVVYVEFKYGDLRDFSGLDVKNKLVIMDFDSGSLWRWAAYLGARGVIFIIRENSKYELKEDIIKRFWIPIDFPRVAVYFKDIADILDFIRDGKVRATLSVGMKYEKRVSYNIIGIINGTDPRLADEFIGLITNYDSWSIIPSIAPGGEDALSTAILLEIAKRIPAMKPRRSVMVAFFSGYYQALAGARHFVYDSIAKGFLLDVLNKMRVVLEVRASAYSPLISIYDKGNFHYDYPVLYESDIIHLVTEEEGVNLKRVVDKAIRDLSNGKYTLYFYEFNPSHTVLEDPRYFNFEIFSLLRIPSIAIAQASFSPYRKTPSDVIEETPEQLFNIQLIASTYATAVKYLVVEYESPLFKSHDFKLQNIKVLAGRTVEYNETSGTYEPLGDCLVVVFYFWYRPTYGQVVFLGPFVRHYIIEKTDSEGNFKIPMVIPDELYSTLAFKDYPEEGPIEYAIDFPFTGSTGVRIGREVETMVRIALFKTGSIVLFDTLDPSTASPLDPERAWNTYIVDHSSQNYARHFGSDVEIIGYIYHPKYWGGVIQLFVNPDLSETPRFDILTPLGGLMWYSLILTNKNRGLYVEPGEQLIIPFTILRIYEDYSLINSMRFKEAKRTHLFTEIVEELLSVSSMYWSKCKEALDKKDYHQARGQAIMAWLAERNAYINLRSLTLDASYSTVFFLLLSIPFSFLMERLIFNYEDLKKRIEAIALIMLLVMTFMYLNHPGFSLVSNIPLIAIAFLMIVLTIFPLTIILNHAIGAIKELRVRFIGKHFLEMDKLSALVLATSLGIRNLRRRYIRTILVLISVIVATTAFVSMISISASKRVSAVDTYTMNKAYEGILIRQLLPGSPLPPLLAEQLKTIYGEHVVEVIPVYIFYPSGEKVMLAQRKGLIIGPTAIVGLHPLDFKVLPVFKERAIREAIFMGGSREFLSPDERACIIPENIAKELGIEIGDELTILGMRLKVVGIFRDGASRAYLSYLDLDRFPFTAFSREEEMTGRLAIRSLTPEDPSQVIFVPTEVAKMIGGNVYAIRIIPKNPDVVMEMAREIATVFNYRVYCSVREGRKYKVLQLATVTVQQVMGQEAIIPAVILLSTILSSILGAVHERRREIGILSSIGLSPIQVAGMFLAEFTVLSVAGAFLGYMAGITLPGIIGGLSVNAGSVWVAVAVALAILVTLLATAYPVRYASRLVTPSLERKWRLETVSTRRGDTFIIRIPFVIKHEEVDGALLYIKEYLDIYRGEEGPFTIDEMEYYEKSIPDGKVRTLRMKMRVKPFDWGVVMDSRLDVKTVKGSSTWVLTINRLSGAEHVWLRGVRKLTDVIRKQLLMWRGLKPAEREEYVKRAYSL